MPTGPEHYRLSEALLAAIAAGQRPDVPAMPHQTAREFTELAHVHATLALAAATAMAATDRGTMAMDDYKEWDEACGFRVQPGPTDA